MKVRMSYGGLGNQNISLYQYIPKLSSNSPALNYPFGGRDVSLGYAITSLPSANIKWETTVYKNLGIDLGLFGNKLEISAEGYVKDTRDMLSTKNISNCTGYGSLTVNDGKLRTTGYEVQIIYHGNAGEFNYDLDMNLSHYKSVLKAMADPNYLYEYGVTRTYVGGEIGEFWAYQTNGIFQSDEEVAAWNKEHGYYDDEGIWYPIQPTAKAGDIRFVDQNGDGQQVKQHKILIFRAVQSFKKRTSAHIQRIQIIVTDIQVLDFFRQLQRCQLAIRDTEMLKILKARQVQI